MRIFDYVGRTIRNQTAPHGVNFVAQYVDEEGRLQTLTLCETYIPVSSGSASAVARVINGTSRICATAPNLNTFTLTGDNDGNLVYSEPNTGQIAFKVVKNEIAKLGLSSENTFEYMLEVGNVFSNIAREGRMPAQYRRVSEIEQDAPTPSENTSRKVKFTDMVDDIPEDVFTMETIIDRIRNCGSIANAKEVPVIIRFDDKKLMITDTSVEDGFLYLDVIEVPKKKLEKPSIKFSDYIKFVDQDLTIGDGIWEQINTSPFTYGNVTSATSASLSSNGSF